MFEKDFLKATAERAIKTFFQTMLALLGTNAVGILPTDILSAAQVSLTAAFLSVLTSFASVSISKVGPSLGGEVVRPIIEFIPVEVPAKTPAKKAAPAAKKPTKKATGK